MGWVPFQEKTQLPYPISKGWLNKIINKAKRIDNQHIILGLKKKAYHNSNHR